jgi:signal peptidase I
MVPVDQVVGRAFVLVWPLDRFSRFSGPATFDQPGLTGAPPMTPRSAMTGAAAA